MANHMRADPTDMTEPAKKQKLRILMTADLGLFPVPPVRYGATERTVATYSRGLSTRGHTVDLIAKAGSTRFSGELHTPPAPSDAYLSRAYCKLLYQPVSLWAARHSDVVHCHSRFDYLEALFKTSKPLALHFHNDARQDHVDWLMRKRRRNLRLVAISHSLRPLWLRTEPRSSAYTRSPGPTPDSRQSTTTAAPSPRRYPSAPRSIARQFPDADKTPASPSIRLLSGASINSTPPASARSASPACRLWQA